MLWSLYLVYKFDDLSYLEVVKMKYGSITLTRENLNQLFVYYYETYVKKLEIAHDKLIDENDRLKKENTYLRTVEMTSRKLARDNNVLRTRLKM